MTSEIQSSDHSPVNAENVYIESKRWNTVESKGWKIVELKG